MVSPSDLLATPVLNAFRTLLAIIMRDKTKLNFSDQCQTKFLLPKSQNEFYDLLPKSSTEFYELVLRALRAIHR